MNKEVSLTDLGNKDFKETWNLQENLFQEILDTKIRNRREDTSVATDNHFLFVEHPHVYTLGKSGDMSTLPAETFTLIQANLTITVSSRCSTGRN